MFIDRKHVSYKIIIKNDFTALNIVWCQLYMHTNICLLLSYPSFGVYMHFFL